MASAESGAEQYDTWVGHLGHLTKQQEVALEDFKQRLAKAKLYEPPTDTAQPSHDDVTLLWVQCFHATTTASLTRSSHTDDSFELAILI